jgi:hypothetical protein
VDEDRLTEKQLAGRWQVHQGTLANQRCAGTGIPFLKLVGVGVRYRLEDVRAAEAAAFTATTGECGFADVTVELAPATATVTHLDRARSKLARRSVGAAA